MTIAIGVACPEGLVLAADSRSTVLSANKFRIATDYAEKVFQIGNRFALVTYGWAVVEGKTIAGVMKEFSAQVDVPDDIDGAAESLRDYVQARVQAHIAAGLDPPPAPGYDVLGFIMGGFDPQGVGHLRLIAIPTGTIHPERRARLRGQTGTASLTYSRVYISATTLCESTCLGGHSGTERHSKASSTRSRSDGSPCRTRSTSRPSS